MRYIRSVRRIVCLATIFPCRTTSRLSNMLLSVTPGEARMRRAPNSTSSASAVESMPSSSGEDVCHPFVGQIGSVATWTCAAPLQIAPNMNAPSAVARRVNLVHPHIIRPNFLRARCRLGLAK